MHVTKAAILELLGKVDGAGIPGLSYTVRRMMTITRRPPP
jgi:hypothetical protein